MPWPTIPTKAKCASGLLLFQPFGAGFLYRCSGHSRWGL
nr:MAG TPA: hypothetical protein [Caudoviricetes sp.]